LLLRLVFALGLFAASTSAGTSFAQIRTDASLGHAPQTLNGPTYLIPETLGKLAANNLFHSFQTFSVRSGEVASFSTTTPGIAHVISRVTGGEVSQINGKIQLSSVGATPDFYLINPAGLVFGAGATLDVPGAFRVGTADSVKFPDGRFNADLNKISTFSSAAPEAFGFLGATRGSLTLKDGAFLLTQNAHPIGVFAGDVDIAGATLATANGGDLRLAALGLAAQDVTFKGDLPAAAGTLALRAGGLIATSTTGATDGGNMAIRAGNVVIDRQGSSLLTGVYSATTASGHAGNLDISAMHALRIGSGGAIYSSTQGAGHAGTVKVSAAEIGIDAQGGNLTGIFSAAASGTGHAGDIALLAHDTIALANGAQVMSLAYASGDSGNVTVATDRLALNNGSQISTASFSSGTSGTVAVTARNMVIDGQGRAATGIGNYAANGRTQAGAIHVEVSENLTLNNGGTILSGAYASGDGGAVHVNAGRIAIDAQGGGGQAITGIYSVALFGTGHAGPVDVTTIGHLSITGGGMISSQTLLSGNAGAVTVRAGSLAMDGKGSGIFSEANPFSSGHGGDIAVRVDGHLALANGALISSNTYSVGQGGTVTVAADSLSIDGQGGSQTGIISETYDSRATGVPLGGSSYGEAGNVQVAASGKLELHNGGVISSSTFSQGKAGNVRVSTDTLRVDGVGEDHVGSQISAEAALGSSGQTGQVNVAANEITLSNGGQISITNAASVIHPETVAPTSIVVAAPRLAILDSPNGITTSSTGNIAAGSIAITASERLQLQGSAISTAAHQGNGGAIAIAGGMLRLDQAQISTSVSGLSGNGGDIAVNGVALVMNTGFIQANTAADHASGGKVGIDVKMLLPSGNTLFVGGEHPFAFKPDVFGFNVIQAAAPTGVSGSIQIAHPILDLSASLVGLSGTLIESGGLGRNPCQVSDGSSLALAGRGGLPPSARGLLRSESRSEGRAKTVSESKSVSLPLISSPLIPRRGFLCL
jgi:filamentous hemagglutinin family protein